MVSNVVSRRLEASGLRLLWPDSWLAGLARSIWKAVAGGAPPVAASITNGVIVNNEKNNFLNKNINIIGVRGGPNGIWYP